MANTISKNATKERLTAVALKLAASSGWRTLTREKIAEKAGVSTGIVSYRFGTMNELRRTVMRAAIAQEVLPVVAEGLALGDRFAKAAPPELRQRAVASL